MLRGTALRSVPGVLAQIQSSMVKDDTRFRIVWNELWHSPQDQTFHQFLDELVVKTLTRKWFEQQCASRGSPPPGKNSQDFLCHRASQSHLPLSFATWFTLALRTVQNSVVKTDQNSLSGPNYR
jgi:hypothetical protein